LQSHEIHNLGITRLPLVNPRINDHFNVIPTKRYKVCYRKEANGLLTCPNHVNIKILKQIHDLKLINFLQTLLWRWLIKKKLVFPIGVNYLTNTLISNWSHLNHKINTSPQMLQIRMQHICMEDVDLWYAVNQSWWWSSKAINESAIHNFNNWLNFFGTSMLSLGENSCYTCNISSQCYVNIFWKTSISLQVLFSLHF